MSRASLLTPPPGWMCHGCGHLLREKPERCPKCSSSVFERTGAVAVAEKTEEGAEGPNGTGGEEAAMAGFECVNDCGRKVSKAGGRCRTCGQQARHGHTKGKAARPAMAPVAADKKDGVGGEFGVAIAKALEASGYTVKEICLTEATLLVRLLAPAE